MNASHPECNWTELRQVNMFIDPRLYLQWFPGIWLLHLTRDLTAT
jgi:hypothetical protein